MRYNPPVHVPEIAEFSQQAIDAEIVVKSTFVNKHNHINMSPVRYCVEDRMLTGISVIEKLFWTE